MIANPWKTRPGLAMWWVIAAALVLAAMRVLGMLGSSQLRVLLPLGFVLMAVSPWLLLTRQGRRQIGLVKPDRPAAYVPAIVLGALAAMACFGIGNSLFGSGQDHWFVSIANYYRDSVDTTGFGLLQLHLMFTLPAILFSPVGEEIFFRGMLQRALEERLSARTSTTVECAAFGIVHLCHHGLLATAAGIVLLPRSAAIWVLLMFALGWLFAWLRRRSGSLYPAMAAHAAFNVSMNVCIFSLLWQRL